MLADTENVLVGLNSACMGDDSTACGMPKEDILIPR
jgi:hypothetical protein